MKKTHCSRTGSAQSGGRTNRNGKATKRRSIRLHLEYHQSAELGSMRQTAGLDPTLTGSANRKWSVWLAIATAVCTVAEVVKLLLTMFNCISLRRARVLSGVVRCWD